MIIYYIDSKLANRIKIYYIPDVDDHEKWTYSIDSIVPSYDLVFSNDKFTQSLYQKRKKQVIAVPLKNRESLSGTLIRSKIANNQNWEESVPNGAKKILQKISTKERLAVFNYK